MLEKVECVGFVDRTVAIHVSRLVYRVHRGKYSVLQQVQGIGFVDCTVTVDIPPADGSVRFGSACRRTLSLNTPG